ncbi:MAG: hypothetical protein ABIN94_13500 [Ferruginibacter sp.]
MNKKQSLEAQLELLKLIEEGGRLAAETARIAFKNPEAARRHLMRIHAFAKQVEETLNNTAPINPSTVSVKVLLELDDFAARHLN